MAFIRKRIKNGNTYYSIARSFRIWDKVRKSERYFGTKKPTKEEMEKFNAYFSNCLSEQEIANLDSIKNNFQAERKNLPKSIREKNLKGFLVKFTYNTNRIEGSTLSLQETKLIIDDKISPKDKPLAEIKEAENHVKAFNYILAYKKDINLDFIKEINNILLGEINDDIAGAIRDFNVGISGSEFIPPKSEKVPFELRLFFDWLQNAKKLHPFEFAMLCHLKFVTIHPFGDGNGRTARLLMNFILKRYGYPMLDITYTARSDYYMVLEKCQTEKLEKPFVDFCYWGYLTQNIELLKKK